MDIRKDRETGLFLMHIIGRFKKWGKAKQGRAGIRRTQI